jgi:hypothetical protein
MVAKWSAQGVKTKRGDCWPMHALGLKNDQAGGQKKWLQNTTVHFIMLLL